MAFTTNCSSNSPRKMALAYGVASGTGTLTNRVGFVQSDMKPNFTFATDTGNNGTLWDRTENFVVNTTSYSGPIQFTPRPSDLVLLLPFMGFGAPVSNVYSAAPICNWFRLGLLDTQFSTVYAYNYCATKKVTFSSQDGSDSILKCNWDVIAAEEQEIATSGFPALTTLSTDTPWVHRQSVLTIGANVHRIKDVTVDIDNQLMIDEFNNAQTQSDFPQDGQVIKLTTNLPYDGATQKAMVGVSAAISASLVYTSGLNVLTFTFPALRAIPTRPSIGQRGSRIRNSIVWTAVLPANASATSVPLSITLTTS